MPGMRIQVKIIVFSPNELIHHLGNPYYYIFFLGGMVFHTWFKSKVRFAIATPLASWLFRWVNWVPMGSNLVAILWSITENNNVSG
jgi:hypothetical protein